MRETPPERRDPFAGLFEPEEQSTTDEHSSRPTTRREAREARDAHPEWAHASYPERERRKRRWIVPTVVVVVIVGLLVGGGGFALAAFQPQIQKIFGLGESNDYEGEGTGKVLVTIKPGDIGSDIARTLNEKRVTKSFEAFYSLLLKKRPQPVFQPGTYELKKQMSAASALSALLDPANRLANSVVIPEGTRLSDILVLASETTEIPLAELEQAASDVRSFDVPADATSLEGFLFPASYTFDPGLTAHDVLAEMVARANEALDDVGIPVEQRVRVVTLASIVQAEAGPNPDDLGKIARVFQNRLDDGMMLQSDATVKYGAGNMHTVWTTDAERADESNAYNTYAHTGLTPTPIGNPGEAALRAAFDPAQGAWIYFVTVNLKSGETVFSTTEQEHDAAVTQLRSWCAQPENDPYCG